MNSYHDQLPEMFDPSEHEGTQDFLPIPAGWYSAHIIEAEVRDAANGNGNYLLTVFEILDGEHQRRKIYQNITIHNASQQAVEIGQRLMTDIYTSCGITGPTQDIGVLLYKPVKIRVAIKRNLNGEYPDGNRVNAVRPPDYEPKRGRIAHAPGAKPTDPTPSFTAPKGDRPWDQK
jgi:hypothetical protein